MLCARGLCVPPPQPLLSVPVDADCGSWIASGGACRAHSEAKIVNIIATERLLGVLLVLAVLPALADIEGSRVHPLISH